MIPFIHHQIRQLIDMALDEDVGRGDITTEATIPDRAMAHARLATKQDVIVAGMEVFRAVFASIDGSLAIQMHRQDGDDVATGTALAELDGRARSLLMGERVALNFLQRLSGIATLTRRYVEAIRGYHAHIIDTRKTTPGWRLLEKYAVRVGGGHNHRHDLGDGVLIKDNHIVAAGGIQAAVNAARARSHHLLKIEVEAATLAQVEEALRAGVEVIMLDNMDLPTMAQAVKQIGGRALVEASGGISLESVVDVARTGVDLISVGKLTHSAPAVDIHLKFDPSK